MALDSAILSPPSLTNYPSLLYNAFIALAFSCAPTTTLAQCQYVEYRTLLDLSHGLDQSNFPTHQWTFLDFGGRVAVLYAFAFSRFRNATDHVPLGTAEALLGGDWVSHAHNSLGSLLECLGNLGIKSTFQLRSCWASTNPKLIPLLILWEEW